MSEGRFIADTLESIVVGMAESLRDAQEAMNEAPPLDAYGRPAPQYRIPHLDFEVGFKLVTETKSGGGLMMRFAPVTSTEAAREVTSTISGRFVSVPAGEGLPTPVLAAQISTGGDTQTLSIVAGNTAGDVLEGATIELNVDVEASTALSQANGLARPKIKNNVTFGSAVLTTDAQGQAETRITLGTALQRKALVVITAELGAETIRITTGKEVA